MQFDNFMHPEILLINEIKRGSNIAFKKLFDEYYSLMCSLAFEYVNDYFTARTIAEDVMLTIWEKKENLHITCSLKQYLLKSTRNRSIDYLRQNNNSRNFLNIDDIDAAHTTCFLSEEDLFEQIISDELEIKIHDLINKMPEECRNVFVLSRYDGLQNQEIAYRINISINTAKYTIKNALNNLRIELKYYIAFFIILHLFNR